MSKKETRFAIIGCGRVVKNHVGPIQDTEGARLVAVCDLVEERAQSYGQQTGAKVYTNYRELLSREDIDVVSVITPSGMHPEHAIEIMSKYRKSVVIEKPMALALKDVDRLYEAAQQAGVKIFPVYQNRYNKAVQKIRQEVVSGRFGKIVLGTIRLRWCRPQRYYDRDPWRGTYAMDGGALTNQGIHYLDLLGYLIGNVRSVNCTIATQLVDVEVEDTAIATVKFESGALGAIEITTAARPDDFEASVSIMGENGTAVLAGLSSNKLETYTFEPEAMAQFSEDIPDAYGFGHWGFYRDVINDLQNGKPHPISKEEGKKALSLLNALYRSAEDNREVLISEEVSSKRLGQPDPKLAALYTTPL